MNPKKNRKKRKFDTVFSLKFIGFHSIGSVAQLEITLSMSMLRDWLGEHGGGVGEITELIRQWSLCSC